MLQPSGASEGSVTLAQAHVIRRAVDALPSSVDADTVARAEAHLVAQAAECLVVEPEVG